MSATTIRGSSPADAIYSGNYPLAVRGVLTGFPNQGPLHTLGYWQSDNAVDIAVPVGTDVVAVASGFVRARGTWAVPFNLSSQTSGWEVLLLGDDGNNYFYSRFSQRLVTDGEHVVQGQVIGKSGGANGVPHLHVAIQPMPTNQAPNPSFERDAVGAAPASWANGSTPSTVFQVQNAWASKGAQSLYVVTQAMLSTLAATAIVDTGVTVGGAGQVFAIAPGQKIAIRADANVIAITGSMKLYTQINWYTAAGGFLSSNAGAIQTGALGVVNFSEVFTAPATTGFTRVFWIAVSNATPSSMSYYLDGALVAVGAAIVPGYNDADLPTDPLARWG